MGCGGSKDSPADENAEAAPPKRPKINTAGAPQETLEPAEAEIPMRYRGFSVVSASKLVSLDAMEEELAAMEAESAAAEDHLSRSEASLPVGLRTELSLLHGNANKLLATKVDAVLTGAQSPGPTLARDRHHHRHVCR